MTDFIPYPDPEIPGIGEEGPQVRNIEDHPGVPDCLDRLWTPYRMVYVDGPARPADESEEKCPFCRAPSLSDQDALIIARGEHAYVLMNLYPYNPGHLLVNPYRHVGEYVDATQDEVHEIADLTQKSLAVIRHVSKPAGFNLGINQGRVGGAGITGHLHQHIVPRWMGDANFLPIIGRTKALPQFLAETRELFDQAWTDLFGR